MDARSFNRSSWRWAASLRAQFTSSGELVSRPRGAVSRPPRVDWTIEPEDLAHISPYLTEHINRFGRYSFTATQLDGTLRPLRDPDGFDEEEDIDF